MAIVLQVHCPLVKWASGPPLGNPSLDHNNLIRLSNLNAHSIQRNVKLHGIAPLELDRVAFGVLNTRITAM